MPHTPNHRYFTHLCFQLSVSSFFGALGEKHSCECSQGDMAHLQEHQTGEEDGPCQSQEAPEEISPSHSPVGTVLLTLPTPLILV